MGTLIEDVTGILRRAGVRAITDQVSDYPPYVLIRFGGAVLSESKVEGDGVIYLVTSPAQDPQPLMAQIVLALEADDEYDYGFAIADSSLDPGGMSVTTITVEKLGAWATAEIAGRAKW